MFLGSLYDVRTPSSVHLFIFWVRGWVGGGLRFRDWGVESKIWEGHSSLLEMAPYQAPEIKGSVLCKPKGPSSLENCLRRKWGVFYIYIYIYYFCFFFGGEGGWG